MQDVQKSCNILACHLICTQFSKKLCKILAQLPCKNSTRNYARCWQKSCNIVACYLICTQDSQRNYARCSKIMQPSCMLFDTYTRFSKKLCNMFKNHATFLHAIWHVYTRFSKKLCKMFKNHATFLHAIWYVHKILKESTQEMLKNSTRKYYARK